MEFLNNKNFKDYEYVEIFEDNGGTDSNGLTSRTSFRITLDDKESTYVPADSFLHIRGQIVNNAGATITAGQIAMMNSGWNLFDKATYKINNVPVEQFQWPGRVHQAHGLVNYSDDYARGQGKNQFWALDGGDGEIGAEPVIEFQVWRNGAATNHFLTYPGAVNSRITASTAGTAGNSIQLFFKGMQVLPYNATQRGFSTFVCPGTDTTNIGVDNAIDNDIIHLYVGGERIYLANPSYNTPLNIKITTGVTDLSMVVDNSASITTNARVRAFAPSVEPTNPGFEERRRRVVADNGNSTNRVFELYMPIREIFKILQEHPMAMRGASHILEFDKQDYRNIFQATFDTQSKVKYIRVSWWVPRVQYQLETESAFIASLNGQKTLTWNSYRIEESGDLGSSSGVWDVATISSMPKRAYVWFQNSSRFDDQTQNCMVYDNLDLSSLYVRLNADRFPEYEYELDFGSDTGTVGERGDNYMRAYNAYLHACGNMAHNHDCLPAVSYEDFKRLYTIYCFEFHDRSERIFRNNQSVQMKVAYTLRAVANRAPYRITCVFDPEKEISIDYSGGMVTKLLSIQ